MSSLKAFIAVALVGVGLLFSGLTIGAFAQANPGTSNLPPLVPEIRFVETTVARVTGFLVTPTIEAQAFGRGFSYMGIAIILSAIASAMVSETTSQTLRRPGRKGA